MDVEAVETAVFECCEGGIYEVCSTSWGGGEGCKAGGDVGKEAADCEDDF